MAGLSLGSLRLNWGSLPSRVSGFAGRPGGLESMRRGAMTVRRVVPGAVVGWVVASMLAAGPGLAATCKSYSSCEQAVRNWCEGRHDGADRDRDGIPCENVCPSKRLVDQIRREIGCRR